MKNIRKIILISLVVAVVIMLSLNIFNFYKIGHIADMSIAFTTSKPFAKGLTMFIGPVVWIVMFVFAMIYTFNKNEDDKKKKWPFIVLVVMASISFIVTGFAVITDADNLFTAKELNGTKPFVFNGRVRFVMTAFSAAALGLAITNLVQVVKGI